VGRAKRSPHIKTLGLKEVSLTIYDIHGYPHNFAVTKIDAPLEQCAFLLDFGRKLERVRWLFGTNKWVRFTVGLIIPVVHLCEQKGDFVIGVNQGEPYFTEIQELWKQHTGTSSSRNITDPDGLEVVADFGRHFPSDC
jgi:hypothetical protein